MAHLGGAFDASSSFSDAILEVWPIHSAVYNIVNKRNLSFICLLCLSFI